MLAKIAAIKQHTPTLVTFYFQPERPMYYLAGQFTELTVPCAPDERGNSRHFTLSSAPNEPQPAITVSFHNSRSAFKAALRALEIGDEVRLDEPLGDFVIPLDASAPLIWVAGGIGITPFRSMARSLVEARDMRDISLFHSVAHPSQAIFADTMEAANVKRTVLDTSTGERLTAAPLLGTITSKDKAYVYISGPEPMVQSLSAELAQHGIAKERIITDAFLGYSAV